MRKHTAWTDALTGAEVNVADGRLRLADAFGRLPLALLASR